VLACKHIFAGGLNKDNQLTVKKIMQTSSVLDENICDKIYIHINIMCVKYLYI
jgi:hypothetical protein